VAAGDDGKSGMPATRVGWEPTSQRP
jgi:hypothetical protein